MAQTENEKVVYGLLASTIPNGGNPKDSVLLFFKTTDGYMDADRYDSAEFSLTKVGDRPELKKPAVFNFYYHSRQAEYLQYHRPIHIFRKPGKGTSETIDLPIP